MNIDAPTIRLSQIFFLVAFFHRLSMSLVLRSFSFPVPSASWRDINGDSVSTRESLVSSGGLRSSSYCLSGVALVPTHNLEIYCSATRLHT